MGWRNQIKNFLLDLSVVVWKSLIGPVFTGTCIDNK